ncbi:MAG TPA: pitrilysin family protein [Burkholderiales bacterium]|nr:pitrilysin family protein [Burkholderiales bacterium]
MKLLGLVIGLALALVTTAARAGVSIEHWQTSSGARVYFVATHELPILDVTVEFPAGSSRDPVERSGLASLTLRMLRAGTQDISEDELSRRLADVGASLGTNLDFDRAGYSVRTLSHQAQRDLAIGTLAALLQAPIFPAQALEREKQRAIAALREGDVKPEVISAREFARLVYGGHPYGMRSTGEVDSVARISRDDVADFYQRFYAAQGAVVSIIGDITREQAEAVANQLTRDLPQGAPPPLLPAVPALSAAITRSIDHSAAQAHIFVGAPGIRRSDPDYFPMWVGNYILGGGGFNSRFTAEVREKRGLSYSVYSTFAPYQQSGAFTIGLQTRKDQAAAALAVVRDTLQRFIAEGPSAQELEDAKQNIIGGFALRIDSNRKILEYVAMIGFYGLPLDYLDQFPERVKQVTVERIRDAFRRRIDPDRLVTVVVGGASVATSTTGMPAQ